ncbi:MAG: RnfABCDGE type electron transport complex subunit G [Mariprofundaceae bacterium]|nr:RnfABCDGE type electron transport complex subunit G [Mariprofundaceae bacterium]
MEIDSKEVRKMIFALVAVATVATLALGFTEQLTRAPIQEARKAAMLTLLGQVLPIHDNDAMQDSFDYTLSDKPTRFYPAFNQKGELQALAWQIVAPDGYAGKIHMIVAVDVFAKLVAMRVIEHRETPGLGDGIVDDQVWLNAFAGKDLVSTHWNVKKDGGDFDQFTGATITPRAVVHAVQRALVVFQKNQKALQKKALSEQAKIASTQ